VPDLKRMLSAGIAYLTSKFMLWASKLLRERDLLLLSGSRVHFVRLTTRLQLILFFSSTCVLLWGGGMSYAVWNQHKNIRLGLDELHEINGAYRDLLGEASAYNSNITIVLKRLTAHRNVLNQFLAKLDQTGDDASLVLSRDDLYEYLRLFDIDVGKMSVMTALRRDSLAKSEAEFLRVDGKDGEAVSLRTLLRNRLRLVDEKLTETQSELVQKENVRASFQENFEIANAELARLKIARDVLRSNIAIVAQEREVERERGDKLSTEITRMSKALLALKNKHEVALRQRTTSEGRIISLNNMLNNSKTHSKQLEIQLSNVIEQLALQTGEEDSQWTLSKMRVTERVAQLLKQLEGVYSSEKETLRLYAQLAAASRANIERFISKTGLDVATLLSRIENIPSGQGGPFIAVASTQDFSSGSANTEREGLADVLSNLDSHLARWDSLREILRVLPLVTPVDNYHVASSYGVRSDPLTKRKAMHYGADLAGWLRSPVYATARGTVITATHQARFGNMVEIDHGYGIRTRYGHFDKILVKKGQLVDFRHQIGLLGNTGRSTGPHVHYEILFDGKQIDPMKFIDAGRYVSKE